MATLDLTVGTSANTNAFNPEELADLWQAIDSSSSDGDECREAGPVDAKREDSMDSTSMEALFQQRSDVRKEGSSSGKATPKRKPRKFTSAQIDMRRKRNRDSMRRVRQRKQVEVDTLRKTMELLQTKLEELCVVRDQATVSASSSSSDTEALALTSPSKQSSRSNVEVQALLEEIKMLQLEQVCLHNAVLSHQQVSATIVQLMDEARVLHFQSENIYASLQQEEDEFLWVNDVLPLLPPLPRSNVYELVRESYLDIVTHFEAADSCRESEHTVLGWSDKRAVDGSWAHILFSKDFIHEDMETLVARTWAGVTYASKGEDFHAEKLHLKVLERLNDDTLIIARNSFFPVDGRYYSSIYVLLRIKTSDGYVIGGRTICPLPANEPLIEARLGRNRSYTHVFCALSFSRLCPCEEVEVDVKTNEGVDSSSAGSERNERGCRVKYGGRIGNGSALFTRTWAMDILLAVLRWENSCVAPLYRLTS